MSSKTCGREYVIIEFDDICSPCKETRRVPVFDVSAAGVTWFSGLMPWISDCCQPNDSTGEHQARCACEGGSGADEVFHYLVGRRAQPAGRRLHDEAPEPRLPAGGDVHRLAPAQLRELHL